MAIPSPLQGAVEVRATDQDRAIELARQRFAELKSVADWSMRADYDTVELLASRKRFLQRVPAQSTKQVVAIFAGAMTKLCLSSTKAMVA